MTEKELEQCINAYGKEIYSFCRHLTMNQTEADDLYQDTFLKLIELKSKIDFKNNPKSY
ncbi:MAG: sigma-70 family RNA polymerase sigma factor, partial [Lachnospiraceae bacterium]|nr:sigma-70 family RNA polymerase sigma factor [Lachnospiraceae bacterium]